MGATGHLRILPLSLLALATLAAPDASGKTGVSGASEADSAYSAVLRDTAGLSLKDRIRRFEQVLNRDRNHAPAHYEIARCYTALNSPMDRQLARNALDRAIQADPQNVDYQVFLGDLLWTQGFLSNSGDQYEQTWKANPQNAKTSYKAGQSFVGEFLRFRDGMGDGGTPGMVFAARYRDEAIFRLERCLALDPGLREAYYPLGVVYIESGQPKGLMNVANRLLKQFPGDKDALLFCGLAAQTLGVYQNASGFYGHALSQMGPGEREMMESVDLLQGKDRQNQILPATLRRVRLDSTRKWYDTPEMARFWERQDPLLLTAYNERQMEHYSRVAYANLRFGDPLRGMAGWQTVLGRTWIKFGRYVQRRTNFSGTSETWFYEGFNIAFSGDGTGKWSMAGGGTGIPSLGIPPWGNIMDADISKYFRQIRSMPRPQNSPSYVFNHTPPRYVDPYRNRKYSLPHQIAAFRDGDSVRVELSYAIPRNRLKILEPEGTADLVDGVFVFDADWKEVYRKPQMTLRVKWPESSPGTDEQAEAPLRNHLVSYTEVRIPPGSYHLDVEVLDRGAGSIGTFRDLRTFSSPGSALSMSDLLLASRIAPRNPSPERREDLDITPNPLRTFRRTEFESVYFEVYNLHQDEAGRTDYQVTYEVGRPKQKEIDPAMFTSLDVPEARAKMEIETFIHEEEFNAEVSRSSVEYQVRYVLPKENQILEEMRRAEGKAETSVTARYVGQGKDNLTYLQIDMAQMPKGIYRLRVTVKDLQTGRTTEQKALFRVIG